MPKYLRKWLLLLIAVLLFPVFTHTAVSQIRYSKPEAKVTELLKTSKAWDGQDIVYPEGKPEVTVVKLSITDRFNTGYHCHPVPNFGYILKGAFK